MPIDMSFVHSAEFKASEAGKTYWNERMEKRETRVRPTSPIGKRKLASQNASC